MDKESHQFDRVNAKILGQAKPRQAQEFLEAWYSMKKAINKHRARPQLHSTAKENRNMVIMPHNMMEGIIHVKTGFHLHKDCVVVTFTDIVMDRCICSRQIGKDESTVPPTSAGSVQLVRQDISRYGDGVIWDIVCQ
eukprot:g29556.t1